MITRNSKHCVCVRVIFFANPATLAEHCGCSDYGLTRKIFIDMNLLSSRSALAGFSCSKPPLNPIKQASSKFVEAFLYRMHRLKSTIS